MGRLEAAFYGTAARPAPQHRRLFEAQTTRDLNNNIWVDLIAVERAITGDGPISLTHEELLYAAGLMLADGIGSTSVARRLGVRERYLYRGLAAGKFTPAPA